MMLIVEPICYSVGVVFYRLLTGNLPFQANTPIAMVQKQISEAPTPAYQFRAGLPDWCQTILDRALAKSAADRFQTAEEFRAALLAASGASATEHTGALSTSAISLPLPAPSATTSPRPSTSPTGTARPAATAPAGADGATVVLRKQHFAVALGLLVVVAVGVGVLAFVALRRPTAVLVASDIQATPSATAAGSASAAVPAAASAPLATADKPAATPKQASSAPAAGGGVAAPSAKAPAKGRASAGRRPVAHPPLAFDAKALVQDGDKWRERDAKALLADGALTVTAQNQDVLQSVPFTAIQTVSYSNSKQPLWTSPEGPTAVVPVSGGAFGFLRGGRHWVTLRTKDAVVIFRVESEHVDRVLAALAERTGLAIDRVAERKDGK